MEMNKSREIGVVGLGLMGCSIIASLLMVGNKVIAIAPLETDLEKGPEKILHYLTLAFEKGFTKYNPKENLKRLHVSTTYDNLRHCELVIECVSENTEIKKTVYQNIEEAIAPTALITTNTSAIPITILKDFLQTPDRFMGMHWAEPAFTSRFLEIVCSDATDITKAEYLYQIASEWGKEPTLVRKDIRGFITNRIMYAMFREAMSLVENDYATIEDVDRACRNDGGQWMAFCGLFRYMDLTGLQAYHTVMKDLLPTLNTQAEVPKLIADIAQKGGNGIINGKGFYNYSTQEAIEWEKAYEDFSFEISKLTARYPIDMVEKKINGCK
jgi:3-hydroxybutyryl-CoA dehydrogenase